ncbi:MAG TPA: glutamate synthase large subunit [Herpetosiphonaceae bacterium]
MSHLLYDPRFEHDACGIGFVARLDRQPTSEVTRLALEALGSLSHRGGVAADGQSGDGAGLLTLIPRPLIARELARLGAAADPDAVALGMIFLPADPAQRDDARALVDDALRWRGLAVLGWRQVPLDLAVLGATARASCPAIEQVLVDRPADLDDDTFERELYMARRRAEQAAIARDLPLYVPSLSCRTVVYKGLMLPHLLSQFYPDLADPAFAVTAAVYHQRFSTNTFPTWQRAQPFRLLSHNGEINTLEGNANWMRTREPSLQSPLLGNVQALAPIIDRTGSDSAQLDNVLELLVRGGRDVRHALLMLVPEAWEHVADLPQDWRDFYAWHSMLMEPWDGPAALSFCDGRIVGSTLDRNGLRPARYLVTDDGLVVVGSEAGAAAVDEARIVRKGRLGPGQMIAVDLEQGRLYDNAAIKDLFAAAEPYGAWLAGHGLTLDELRADQPAPAQQDSEAIARQQAAFGYTSEALVAVLKPMLRDGAEPVGSMGDDTPAAVLSRLGRPVSAYLKQRFAEVTNPPIDPLREQLVMSLSVSLGGRHNILSTEPNHAHLIRLPSPVLSDRDLAALRGCRDRAFACATLDATFPRTGDPAWLREALEDLCAQAELALEKGAVILIISDRAVERQRVAIPMTLAVGAVHHHLIRIGKRAACSLVAESGEPHEVHHLAVLTGYGAEAVNPWLALATVRELSLERARTPITPDEAEENYRHALEKGLLKVMSKMGISTFDSYCGAQVFEAIGLDNEVIERCLAGTAARFGGATLARLAREALLRHKQAYGDDRPELPHPGNYKFKKDGEYHALHPAVVHALQKAVNTPGALNGHFSEGYAAYRDYAALVTQRPPTDPRDVLEFVERAPVLVDEVEPIETIVRRFSTAAISHGSLSSEAHETLAVAMNRLGGMSNSGEGGENPARYGTERVSAIKQIASGRFGVTPQYLMHARELQIKMAQGSKPGEGGQLPGHKVSEEIASIRHTTPGVTLISPPPHHDIYSIEDLAQLIADMRAVNPSAAVSVKLVAELGVGTVAAGVAKAGADVILISGHSGGTGASPLSSIKNAGLPWEIGLAETQQTLVINDLRGRVRLRADGGLKTGRDVVIAALLGADEYSFGTTALIAEGCVMARACHNNTCPVGIATQRPDLRAKYTGTPEQVMAMMRYIAQEVRELLAALGFRSLDEIIGRPELLRQRATGDIQIDVLDLAALIADADPAGARQRRHAGDQRLAEVGALNERILEALEPALRGEAAGASFRITNQDRTVGATLAGRLALAERPGPASLAFHGSAGQSFGAFATRGMQLVLVGEANDYVGKGLAGGEIAIRPPDAAAYAPHEAVILGNTALYGATGGALFAAGQAGERFAVRNSGASAVVEGVGDHGCEYMTGGTVVVLGATGRNFGAGMTGGSAFVLDPEGLLPQRLNGELVRAERVASPLVADHLRALIERHYSLTGSPRAAELLADWPSWQSQFWHVAPAQAVVPAAALPAEARQVRAA